jgi:MFS transporter, NNP family, nitrate/nitrite transporter
MNFAVADPPKNKSVPTDFQIASVLLLMVLFYFNFLPRLIMAPLMVTVEHELHFGHDDSGKIFLLISTGYCISLFFSGFLSSKISHRKTIFLSSCAVGFVLLIISITHYLPLIKFELFLLGVAAGPYFPSGITTVPTLVNLKHQGKAISLHELAVPLSFVTAPIIAEIFLRIWSWRGLLASLGAVSILIGLIFLLFGKGGRNYGEAPSFKNIGILLRDPSFHIIAFLFVLAIGASNGIYSMLPLYLVSERFFERGWANALVSLSRVPGLITVLFAGFALDRMGIKKTLVAVLFLTGIMTIALGTVPNQAVAPVLLIQYMGAACFFPAGWLAISRIGNPSARNIAISLAVPIAYIFGAGLLPAGIGFAGEYSSFSMAITLFGTLIVVGGFLSRFLKVNEA